MNLILSEERGIRLKKEHLKVISDISLWVGILLFAVLVISGIVVDWENADVYTLVKYIRYRNIFLVISCGLVVLKLIINARIRKR